jgi:hypothetical protein
MSFRYPAGLLTATSPVNAQYPSGVWTQQQSTVYQSQGLFATDPQFRYATMLLHGNGTNCAQNNTFLDSSTNNFTITRNGNTTQGTFTPYIQNGYWSNNFNGSSGYLTVPSSSLFKPASSNFTIEAWVFVANTGTQQQVYGDCDSGTNNGICLLAVSSTLKVQVDYFTSSSAVVTKTTTGSIQANAWNHICVSKTGTTMYIGYNGTLETFTGIPSTMQSPATIYPTIARLGAYNGLYVNGYISNLRYVIGSAVYTGSTYTVPTSPLTAISGTSILTCQSNRFVDNSSNALAITVNGSPNVQDFQPFAPTTAYSASVIGGSGYFDGTGDYLSTPSTGQFSPSGDFTISCWYYPTTTNTFQQVIGNFNGSASTVWIIEVTSGTGIAFYTNGTSVRISGSSKLNLNAWNYLVLARSGSTITGYVNGVSVGTYSQSGTFGSSTQAISIGRGGSSTASGDVSVGYIADVKLIDGSAVTTVPTAPQTATSGTQLLLSYTNAGILDNAMSNDLETVGNAQISTSVVKYGTGSIYFDGSSSGLAFYANLQNLQFSTGDFTIECWVNKTANGTNAYDAVVGLGSTVNATQGWYLEVSTSRGIYFVINNTSVSYATWVNDGLWHHIAVTRSSGTVYIFKDGVLLTSGSLSTTVPTTATAARVGNYYNGSTNYYFNGYIDELRITKGYARYTASFTAPIAPFPNQ